MSYQSTGMLKDRVAIVTGGAGGIGLETTKAMLAQGATVVISDIDTAKGGSAAKELGIEFFRADLTCSAEVSELAKYVLKQHGKIDVAFNNAGIAHSVPGEECTDEQWLRVININLNAVFYCCREFGQAMLAQGRGSIINTASMSGIISNNPQPQCG
jgi:NAD(P)-dependent dehydrogenase (short-subunit alcohol dehydrogenase family)